MLEWWKRVSNIDGAETMAASARTLSTMLLHNIYDRQETRKKYSATGGARTHTFKFLRPVS